MKKKSTRWAKDFTIVYLNRIGVLLLALCCFILVLPLHAQVADSTMQQVQEKDMSDVFRQIFKRKEKTSKAPARFTILPSFGYNPSFGLVIGAKMAAGLQFGDPKSTQFSSVGLEALYTSKGIITLQAIHNIFKAGNSYNWQGNWQVSRFGIIDYGLGSQARSVTTQRAFAVNEFPVGASDSSVPIKYTYIRLNEKLYKKIGNGLYAGVGVSFNLYSGIKEEKANNCCTPHQQYSLNNAFNPEKYASNGWLLAVQYNKLEHPFRSYRGEYADVNLRFNPTWMGSTKRSVQVQYDFRKYVPLGSKNPAHVLALWHWASYKISGSLPYLELPSTGSDTYKRSGRGYTIGRFKGPSFAYFEIEHRFPITSNKLISGVYFLNLQAASDASGNNMYRTLDRGAGAGLRVLFKKQSRSTLCIDYAKGQYGSSGLFFGLNEVF